MVPTLNVEAKHVLLQQALEHGNDGVFLKILFVKRCFINLARLHSVYRFEIEFGQDDVTVWLRGRPEKTRHVVRTTLERAQQLFRFLNPKIIVVLGYAHQNEEFINLLENADCQVVVPRHCRFICKPSPTFIKRIWLKIVEIWLLGHEFEHFNDLPKKSFDKLEICEIETLDHLREALRHDTKELNLYTHASLFRHSNLKEIQNIVTGKIKTCKISLGIYSFRMSLPFMESLVKLLQSNLSRLEIHVPSPKLHDWTEPEHIVENILDNVRYSTRLADSINEIGASFQTTISFGSMKFYKPGVDWIAMLKQKSSLKNLQIETKIMDLTTYSKLKSNIGKVKIELGWNLASDYRPKRHING